MSEPAAPTRRAVAAGDGWEAFDILCTAGPRDRAFEERTTTTNISLVVSGTFVYRGQHGKAFLSSGALLLGNADQSFECSHEHGQGDHCLSFHFERDFFARLARDAGAPGASFDRHVVPPARALAPLCARAQRPGEDLEEVAVDLAAAVLASRDARAAATTGHEARIGRALRHMEAHLVARHTLADLARAARLSPYHFLRTFRRVTGTTPHQWLLRARLREAARRLTAGRQPITEISLDVGFEDLSNFIRSFRAEFGQSPRRYRTAG